MRISIVIPSYNQGAYLGETLDSIFDQNYPDLEVIIMDGGSQDNTLEVIKQYEDQISYWESKPDNGQTDAINKGLKKISGEIWCYLNSDDLLRTNCLNYVSNFFRNNPNAHWLSGGADIFDESGIVNQRILKTCQRSKDYLSPWSRDYPVFPFSGSCFMKNEVINDIGVFDESFHYSMDMEYYARAIFVGDYKQFLSHEILAAWRWHGQSKTMLKGIAYAFRQDEVVIAERYVDYLEESQRDELIEEIEEQKLEIELRKAYYKHKTGKKWGALAMLVSFLLKFPQLLSKKNYYRAIWYCLKIKPESA